MASQHDRTAQRIAKKYRAEVKRGAGPDIVTNREVIAVQTAKTIHNGFKKLRGYRRRAYIACTDASATRAALEAVQGTTVGVIDQNCTVRKPSTRKLGVSGQKSYGAKAQRAGYKSSSRATRGSSSYKARKSNGRARRRSS